MSTIMANNYKEDNSYVKTIDKFLQSGSSANVADIFKNIGIDTTSTTVFESALDNQAADISQFEKFVKSSSK